MSKISTVSLCYLTRSSTKQHLQHHRPNTAHSGRDSVIFQYPHVLLAYVIGGGGTNDTEPVNTVEVFCHSSSQWYAAEPHPIPSYLLTSATVGNITYFLGGSCICHGEAKHCFSVSLDSLIDNSTSPAASPSQHGLLWTRVSDIPVSSCAVSLRGSLLAVGGNLIDHSEVYQPSIHLLTSSGSWESLGGDLAELTLCTAVCLPSGELMVIQLFVQIVQAVQVGDFALLPLLTERHRLCLSVP